MITNSKIVQIVKVENGYTWTFSGKMYIESNYDIMVGNIKTMLEAPPQQEQTVPTPNVSATQTVAQQTQTD